MVNSNLATNVIATGTDLNNLVGNITVYGNKLVNSPNSDGVFIISQIQMDANNKWQIAVGMNLSGSVHSRNCRNGAWRTWFDL